MQAGGIYSHYGRSLTMTDDSPILDNESPKTSARRLNREQQSLADGIDRTRLTAGIGHDFNQVLNIIRGYTELLLEELRQNDAAREKLIQINKAIESGALLSRQLVARGRNDLPTRISISVNSLIEQLHDSLARLLADRVELHLDLGSNVGSVMLYPGQLQQVVMNLVVNAYEAMPKGGCLTIKTAACDLDESPADHPQGIQPRHCILIEVSDTGYGIEPAVRSRIFEPFFSTKNATGGTGLGLANVREILTQSGGEIRVESVLGKGSTFRVFLPR